MRRQWMIAAMAAAAGLAAIAVTASPWRSVSAAPPEQRSAPPAETAAVQRQNLTADRKFDGTVTFGDPWTLRTEAAGVVTASHAVGAVVGFGEELLRIDDKPVFLARGDMPMYRELAQVDTFRRYEAGNRRQRQTGDDVAQLQQFLLDAGFDANGRLATDGIFGARTASAVEAWQKAVGLPVTGTVDSAQLVFSPQPVRIVSIDRVGNQFTELQVGLRDAEVRVETSTRDRGYLPEGAPVVVRLAGADTALEGVVRSQEETKDQQGSTVWRTTIVTDSPIDPAHTATSATVEVTRVVAEDVLTVPVAALLALGEGGYAVERVSDPGSTILVPVELGEVVDGIAEIDGDLTSGDEVVVPS